MGLFSRLFGKDPVAELKQKLAHEVRDLAEKIERVQTVAADNQKVANRHLDKVQSEILTKVDKVADSAKETAEKVDRTSAVLDRTIEQQDDAVRQLGKVSKAVFEDNDAETDACVIADDVSDGLQVVDRHPTIWIDSEKIEKKWEKTRFCIDQREKFYVVKDRLSIESGCLKDVHKKGNTILPAGLWSPFIPLPEGWSELVLGFEMRCDAWPGIPGKILALCVGDPNGMGYPGAGFSRLANGGCVKRDEPRNGLGAQLNLMRPAIRKGKTSAIRGLWAGDVDDGCHGMTASRRKAIDRWHTNNKWFGPVVNPKSKALQDRLWYSVTMVIDRDEAEARIYLGNKLVSEIDGLGNIAWGCKNQMTHAAIQYRGMDGGRSGRLKKLRTRDNSYLFRNGVLAVR